MKHYLVTYSHEWMGGQWVSVAHIYPASVWLGNTNQLPVGHYLQDNKDVGDVDIVHDHTV